MKVVYSFIVLIWLSASCLAQQQEKEDRHLRSDIEFITSPRCSEEIMKTVAGYVGMICYPAWTKIDFDFDNTEYPIDAIAFSRDKSLLAVSHRTTVYLFRSLNASSFNTTAEEYRVHSSIFVRDDINLPSSRITSMAFSHDNTRLAVGRVSSRYGIYILPPGNTERRYSVFRRGLGVADIEFSPDSEQLTVAYNNGSIVFADSASRFVSRPTMDVHGTGHIAYTDSGRHVLTLPFHYSDPVAIPTTLEEYEEQEQEQESISRILHRWHLQRDLLAPIPPSDVEAVTTSEDGALSALAIKGETQVDLIHRVSFYNILASNYRSNRPYRPALVPRSKLCCSIL